EGIATPNYTFVDFPAEHAKNASDNSGVEKTDPAIYEQGIEQIRAVVEREQIDVIHAHFTEFGTYCCAQGELRPLVVSIWGNFNDLLVDRSAQLGRKMQKILDQTDGLIVESPALLGVAQRLRRPPPCPAVIPLGTNTQRFRPASATQRAQARRAFAIPAEAVVILSPRGLGHFYNHDRILAAYLEARQHFTQPTILAFVQMSRGSYDSEAQDIHDAIQQAAILAGIQDEIRWLPSLRYELMPTIYGLADIVVSYPENDAFPSTLVEAAACECAIITACLPSYQNTFIEEFCLQVEPRNTPALTDGLVEMVNGFPKQWRAQTQRARQVIIEEYEERIMQNRLVTLYQTVIEYVQAQQKEGIDAMPVAA
ncbi:MAG: glycosyltransferase family 4 protein, partial [Caldilineaceae bacterium]